MSSSRSSSDPPVSCCNRLKLWWSSLMRLLCCCCPCVKKHDDSDGILARCLRLLCCCCPCAKKRAKQSDDDQIHGRGESSRSLLSHRTQRQHRSEDIEASDGAQRCFDGSRTEPCSTGSKYQVENESKYTQSMPQEPSDRVSLPGAKQGGPSVAEVKQKTINLEAHLWHYVQEFKTDLQNALGHQINLEFTHSDREHHRLTFGSRNKQSFVNAQLKVDDYCNKLRGSVVDESVPLPGDISFDEVKDMLRSELSSAKVMCYHDNKTCHIVGPCDKMFDIHKQLLEILGGALLKMPSGIEVQIYTASLLDAKVDVIVNPADTQLSLGGAVSNSILNAAGSELKKECEKYISARGPLTYTSVMHTTAGRLRPMPQYVIHVAGPPSQIYPGDAINKAMLETFYNCLAYANDKLAVSSLAIPAIGTGGLGVSEDVAALAACKALYRFSDELCNSGRKCCIKKVHYVNINPRVTQTFASTFQHFSSVADMHKSPKVASTPVPDSGSYAPKLSAKADTVSEKRSRKLQQSNTGSSAANKSSLDPAFEADIVNQKDIQIQSGKADTVGEKRSRKLQQSNTDGSASNKSALEIDTSNRKDQQMQPAKVDTVSEKKSAKFEQSNTSSSAANKSSLSPAFEADTINQKDIQMQSSQAGGIINVTDLSARPLSGTESPTDRCEFVTPSGIVVKVYQGDLLKEQVGAIINPANGDLRHSAGAAKAIADAAGSELINECDAYIKTKGASLPVTHATPTTAGKLNPPIRYVIHVVGPTSSHSDLPKVMCNTFYNCLRCANEECKVESVAIPAVSTGIFGVPKDVVARAAYDALMLFDGDVRLKQQHQSVKRVHFVNIDAPTAQVFIDIFQSKVPSKSQPSPVSTSTASKFVLDTASGTNTGQERDDKKLLPSENKADKGHYLEVEEYVWKYIEKYHESDIQAICGQEIKCTCLRTVIPYRLELEGTNGKSVVGKCDEIAKLCQQVSSHIAIHSFRISQFTDVDDFKNIVKALVDKNESVAYMEKDMCHVVGPKDRIDDLRKQVMSLLDNGHKNAVQITNDSPTDSQDIILSVPNATREAELFKFTTPSGISVTLCQGNLIGERVDAIVNPANGKLKHGSGAARAIADAAGYELAKECQKYIKEHGDLKVSQAMHTTSGKLAPDIRYVIHVVGPKAEKAKKSDEKKLHEEVHNTFYNCFLYANDTVHVRSLSVPAISSGRFGVPKALVATAAFEALMKFDKDVHSGHTRYIHSINFINNDKETADEFHKEFKTQYDRLQKSANESHSLGSVKQPVGSDVKMDSLAEKSEPIASASSSGSRRNRVLKSSSSVDPNIPCSYCENSLTQPEQLPCEHRFCAACIIELFELSQPVCPTCQKPFGVKKGNQPPGNFTVHTAGDSLTGYDQCSTIQIEYDIPGGIQDDTHPTPGQEYDGIHCHAYLPNNAEGNEVCRLLKQAFDAGLTFTVGHLFHANRHKVVWKQIQHKTCKTGTRGYPDDTYMSRVKNQLKALGITPYPTQAEPMDTTPDTQQSKSAEFCTSGGIDILVYKWNLVEAKTAVIVNPCNEMLSHGGGAAKAIADAAGQLLIDECDDYIKENKMLDISDVMYTTAGNMNPPIRYVIHAAGPPAEMFPDKKELYEKLMMTFYKCLIQANQLTSVNSVSIPAISSGIFGVPKEVVANAAYDALMRFDSELQDGKQPHNLKKIHYINLDDETTVVFVRIFTARHNKSNSDDTSGGGGDYSHQSVGNVELTSGAAQKRPRVLKQKSTEATPPDSLLPASQLTVELKLETKSADGHGAPSLANTDETSAPASKRPRVLKQISVDASQPKPDSSGSQPKADSTAPAKDDDCVICMCPMTNPIKLECGHKFCTDCIEESFKKCQPKCPSCGRLFGIMKGNQPPGTMTVRNVGSSLPGYETCGTIEIEYSIPNGTQNDEHPHPGEQYYGTHRYAYLPNNKEGQEVCQLLRKAFDAKLIFTVGRSITTGQDNCVIWNDIHHKTSHTGQFGYPDPSYLTRIKEELKAKGIITGVSPGSTPGSDI